MTLRTRLLITFMALGALPLMVVGWVTNQRNLRAVEDLVAGETRLVAERVSEEIGARYDARLGEILFLAGNEETLRLLGEASLPAFGLDPQGPEAFLRETFGTLQGRYRWLRFRDADGRPVLHLPSEIAVENDSLSFLSNPRVFLVSETILSPSGNGVLGTVSAAVESGSLLPPNLPDRGFGEGGFVAVVHTERDRVLYHPDPAFLARPRSDLLPIPMESVQAALSQGGRVQYAAGDQAWIGSLLPIRTTEWAVLSSSPLQGFASPFRGVARANLLLVLAISVLAAMAFLVTTLRTTRSLVELTRAARRVAGGDLDPDLPPAAGDEVGVLSGTFGAMLARIRAMIRQVEENRQMAAVGEFSAQIAHELRNPLTAVRMSLQGLQRKLGGTEHARPLEIALHETARLDRVASGVLSLGRRTHGVAAEVSAAGLVKGAISAVESELRERGVEVRVGEDTPDARVHGDEEGLRGALINLLRNAMEAMPDGGEIEVSIRSAGNGFTEVHLSDSGPGITADLVDRAFDPFVTTKERGNGFGLPLALRAVEASGGRLRLLESEGSIGAHFLLEIPTGPDLHGQKTGKTR